MQNKKSSLGDFENFELPGNQLEKIFGGATGDPVKNANPTPTTPTTPPAIPDPSNPTPVVPPIVPTPK